MPAFKNISGQTFGRWIVLKRATIKRGRDICWLCRCECGAVRDVVGNSLRQGTSKSCGCLSKEQTIRRSYRHGHNPLHGTATRCYLCWANMIQRCSNPKRKQWHNYGGRGIRVDDRWKVFNNFLADMGEPPTPQHSIDRINNDGNYEPGNCRWATQKIQCRNKTNNHVVSFNGKQKCVTAWAEETSIPASTIYDRLHRGWSGERALTTPSNSSVDVLGTIV